MTPRQRILTVCTALILSCGGVACNRSTPEAELWDYVPAEVSGKIKNVLLISLDTTRADYLGCYGYEQPTTPHLDALAASGTLFEQATSPVPMTLPAHCSLLTGTNPPRHGVRQNIKYQLTDAHQTLAEVFQANGFATGAIVAAHVLDDKYGVAQGFETYDQEFEGTERAGDQVSAHAARWLRQHVDQPFFLWLHYFDPHAPFEPPAEFAARFKDGPHADYVAEIAAMDDALGQLFKQLDELGLADSTVVVVVGDHGEGLGEHGETYHSYFIYQNVARVPLIMKVPGDPRSRRIDERVSLIDVAPTLCTLFDLDVPAAVEGEDLTTYLFDDSPTGYDRPLYCESLTPTIYGANPVLGLTDQDWKLVQSTRCELYNLANDPNETQDLSRAEPERTARMQKALSELIAASASGAVSEDAERAVDAEGLRQLQSLGYVGGSVSEDYSLNPELPSASDLIDYHRMYMQVGDFLATRRLKEAQELCLALIKARPEIYCAYSSAADALMMQGKLPLVIKFSRKALELNPDDIDSHYRLAVALHMNEKLEESSTHYERALELNPLHVDARVNYARALIMQQKHQEAAAHLRTALELDPNNPQAREQLRQATRGT